MKLHIKMKNIPRDTAGMLIPRENDFIFVEANTRDSDGSLINRDIFVNIHHIDQGYTAHIGRITKLKGPHFFDYHKSKQLDTLCIHQRYGTDDLQLLWKQNHIKIKRVSAKQSELFLPITEASVYFIPALQAGHLGPRYRNVSVHDVNFVMRKL